MRDSLTCRKCSGLDFASRHLHRSTPQVHRIRRPREQIGADLAPFSPLPERPRYYKRLWRLVARILLEEQSLVRSLGTVNRDLDRRHRIRRERGWNRR
jgi:hypothetical protein